MKVIGPGILQWSDTPIPEWLSTKYELLDGLWRLKITDCKFKYVANYKTKCGQQRSDHRCSLKMVGISPSVCKTCKEKGDGYEPQGTSAEN